MPGGGWTDGRTDLHGVAADSHNTLDEHLRAEVASRSRSVALTDSPPGLGRGCRRTKRKKKGEG